MNDPMSHEEFQNYLGLLSRLLRLRAPQRESIEEELRAHMEERFAALTSEGIEPARAVSMALAEFGDAAALAGEFSAISRLRTRRWIMRLTIGSIAATLLATAAIVSLLPDDSGQFIDRVAQAEKTEETLPAASMEPAAQDPDSITLEKLDTITELEMYDQPLAQAFAYLSDVAALQFYVDNFAIEQVGLKVEEALVTISLSDVPVEMLLRLVLREHDLTYILDHGVVIITTPEVAEDPEFLKIRVYRVDDLVEKSGEQGPRAFPEGVSSFGGGDDSDDEGGSGDEDHGFGAVFSSRPREKRTSGPPYNVNALTNVITIMIEPESWEDVGGPAAIEEFRGALVILQNQSAHRKVEDLLRGLREVVGK